MTTTGRAAVYVKRGEPFEMREYPVPDPKDRDVVVRVTRANVCGSDLHLWNGDTDLAAMGLTYGIILGHELTGRVHALGKKVSADSLGRTLSEGDRVVFTYYVPCEKCAPCLKGMPHACLFSLASPIRSCDEPPHFLGGFAEYYYLKSRQRIFKLPDSVSDEAAAGANCALSQMIHGFDVAGLRLGETVVVQGLGGLGLAACAVARESGAQRVIAVDAVSERLERAQAFGADETIDMREIDNPRQRVDRVMELTFGNGADVVVEVAGVPEAVNEGVRMVARTGRYLEIGNISPRRTYKADPSLLVGFNRSILGVSLYPPTALARAVDFLARTKDRYPFHALTSHTCALDEIDAGFDLASRGAASRVAIVPGGAS